MIIARIQSLLKGSLFMLINYTNHPQQHWSKEQLEAVKYGEIVDMPFPTVSPYASTEEIQDLAKEESKKILAKRNGDTPFAVLCQGEFTLTYCLSKILRDNNIDVLCACSERRTSEKLNPDGSVSKNSEFVFVGFRKLP